LRIKARLRRKSKLAIFPDPAISFVVRVTQKSGVHAEKPECGCPEEIDIGSIWSLNLARLDEKRSEKFGLPHYNNRVSNPPPIIRGGNPNG